MKILVTTPTGKVGAEVAKQLVARGADLRLGAHSPDKVRKAFPAVEAVRLDYADEASVRAAVAGVEAIYLASPGDSPAEPEQRLLDLARAAGVRRAVKLSAHGVENGDSPLRQVEKHLEASGLEWTILRPNWFMQNFSTSQADAIRAGTLAEPAGDGRSAFIDTRDIAAVAVSALTGSGHAGKAYALSGPESLDRNAVAAQLSKAIGREVRYLPVTDEQFRAAVKGFLSPSYTELLSLLYGGTRQGWFDAVTDTVEKLLGRPPISFGRFAEDHKAVWR